MNKKTKGVEYADDYSTIKRWVIDRIEEQEDRKNKKSEIKEKKGYYRHYNQRSYPDDFWDSFYCNQKVIGWSPYNLILKKQYKQISLQLSDCINLLVAWRKSDAERK